MSASGKSSNRHSEYNRGYLGGGGHGIYVEQGERDRAAADTRNHTGPAPARNPSSGFPIDRLRAQGKA